MIIFYVESKNGNYSSENGDRRFDKLTGQKVFDFLNSEAGKGRRFMKVNDDGELNKVYVEVPSEQVKAIRKDERHKQYLSDCRNASGFIVVSIYDTELCREDCSSGEELIADDNCDIENEVLHNMNLEKLRKALRTLSKEEMLLINALFLSDEPVTEKELAEVFGISQQAIHKRKKAVLLKLKNFF
ncbi:MAG: hypothetical protein IJY82_01400 [Oscillospiraceae bacterium]|nr:hypothetical protein [Oscillospiraceae bacterium]